MEWNVQKGGSLSPGEASIKLQAWWRSRRAGTRIIELLRANHQRVWDPENESYYYHNIKTGESQWELALLKGAEFEPRDSWAARVIQLMWRREKMKIKVEFHNNSRLQSSYRQQQSYTGEEVEPMGFGLLGNHWREGSPGPGEQLANLIVEQMDTSNEVDDEEVEDLRAQLIGAREQLQSTRKELEKYNISTINSAATIDSRASRSNHMHHWDEEQTAMWLEEIGFPKYACSAKSYGLDGLELLSMSSDDFHDVGVKNPLHMKRLQIALQPYRLKFKDKQATVGVMDAPGETSYYPAEEKVDMADHIMPNANSNVVAESDDEEQQRDKNDTVNMVKEILFEGNSEGRPKLGNAVKLHYTCSLEDERVIEDSNKYRQVPFEFILGDGCTVIGMERAILTMSSGERAKFVLQPGYAYGESEYPPILPAGSRLVFDINLISFRQS